MSIFYDDNSNTEIKVVNIRKFGAIGNGVTDDTTAVQNAINSGYPLYVPTGIYLITSTLTIPTTTGFRIYGDGQGSILKSSIVNGTALLDLNDAQHISIEKLRITGASGSFIGIEFGGANRWRIDDVSVIGGNPAVKMDNAHIGSISNLFIGNATLGISGQAINDVYGDIHIENCSQSFIFDASYGFNLNIMSEGTNQTASSKLNNIRGAKLNLYLEYTNALSVAPIIIGDSASCVNLDINQVSSKIVGSNAPIFDIRDCRGVKIAGTTILNNDYNFASVTATSYDVIIDVRDLTSAFHYPAPIQVTTDSVECVNYFPDPLYHLSIPSGLTTSQASAAEELTIKPYFATRSLKVTATVGQTLCYANKNITVAAYPHLNALLGKTLGVGYWLYVPSGYEPSSSVGADLFVRCNGTGSPVTNVLSTTRVYGKWIFISNAVSCPSDTTSFDIRYHANRSGSASTSNTIAYFVGPYIWIGNMYQGPRVAGGQISHHPDTFLV